MNDTDRNKKKTEIYSKILKLHNVEETLKIVPNIKCVLTFIKITNNIPWNHL